LKREIFVTFNTHCGKHEHFTTSSGFQRLVSHKIRFVILRKIVLDSVLARIKSEEVFIWGGWPGLTHLRIVGKGYLFLNINTMQN